MICIYVIKPITMGSGFKSTYSYKLEVQWIDAFSCVVE